MKRLKLQQMARNMWRLQPVLEAFPRVRTFEDGEAKASRSTCGSLAIERD